MKSDLLPDDLWNIIEPLLPKHSPSPLGGRPRVDDRQALRGILFVLQTGIPWESLPHEVFGCCGMTCWNRLTEWTKAGVWKMVHAQLLAYLRSEGDLDLSRAALDSSSVRAVAGGEETGPNPTDRGKPGTKHHVIVDRNGVPINATISAANRPDAEQFAELLDGVPAIRGRPGRPRRRPAKIHADKGYDSRACRQAARSRGITPRIARRGIESKERLGRYRWVVERSLAWLHRFRKLRMRDERSSQIHLGLLFLGVIQLCWGALCNSGIF